MEISEIKYSSTGKIWTSESTLVNIEVSRADSVINMESSENDLIGCRPREDEPVLNHLYLTENKLKFWNNIS